MNKQYYLYERFIIIYLINFVSDNFINEGQEAIVWRLFFQVRRYQPTDNSVRMYVDLNGLNNVRISK